MLLDWILEKREEELISFYRNRAKKQALDDGRTMPKKGDHNFMEFCECGRRMIFSYGVPANTYRCEYCTDYVYWV